MFLLLICVYLETEHSVVIDRTVHNFTSSKYSKVQALSRHVFQALFVHVTWKEVRLEREGRCAHIWFFVVVTLLVDLTNNPLINVVLTLDLFQHNSLTCLKQPSHGWMSDLLTIIQMYKCTLLCQICILIALKVFFYNNLGQQHVECDKPIKSASKCEL